MMDVNGSSRVRFGAYEADLHTRELWKHGVKLKLVGQPFDILAVLVSRPGQLVTREELRTQLWPGDTFVDFNHGLNAAVNKLRDALCDSADDPKYIETLPRRGYRFSAPVETTAPLAETVIAARSEDSGPRAKTGAAGESTGVLPDKAAPTTAVPSLETIANQPNRRARWARRAVAAAVLIVGFGVLAHVGVMEFLRSESEGPEKGDAARSLSTPLTSLSDATSEPAFSADGTRVAFRRQSFVPENSGIWVKQVGGEELIQLTKSDRDCCPVWSPDSRSVAFSRFSGDERTIYEVSATGGTARALLVTSLGPKRGELDWSPDRRYIAFVDKGTPGASAIFLLAVEGAEGTQAKSPTSTAGNPLLQNLAVRQVTMPASREEDWYPAFSPEGERILFVRSGGKIPDQIMVMPVGGGEVERLNPEPLRVAGPPAWAADGQSIIFASINAGKSNLWRIPVSGGKPSPIPEAGSSALRPSVSRRGFRLAFQQLSGARNIEQMDLVPPGQKPRGLVTTVSGENAGAQFSPDGKRLVFFSDRTGGLDLWLSDRDGQNAVQLTGLGTAGTPRWSPDGKFIAFDVGLGRDWQLPHAIFIISGEGGTPRSLVQDSYDNAAPSWSRDGQWVYFPSNRFGSWQVWKVPASGGTPVQITTQGGFAAWEGPDGNLYYAKHRYEGPELWRVPVGGGPESPVYPPIRPVDWAAWTVVEKGILFVEAGANDSPTLSFLDFRTLRVAHIATLEKTPFWLGAKTDGKSVAFDQPESDESHIMILENFR